MWSLHMNDGNTMYARFFFPLAISFLLLMFVGCTKENSPAMPVVVSGEVKEFTASWAIIAGNMVKDEGHPHTAFGVCWDTIPQPTIDHYDEPGQPTGSMFKSTITGLKGNTTYYVRAFATNEAGTAYGNQLRFETPSPDDKPLVDTKEAENIFSHSALIPGDVKTHGGTAVTQYGMVWAADPDLQNHGETVFAGAGIGAFSVHLDELDPETSYYYKAFAENESGIAFGAQKMFHTPAYDACQGIMPPQSFGVVAFDGKCWLDRNLEAVGVATAFNDENAYGGLFQWGREPDGHQNHSAQTTQTLAPPGEQPGHGDFIVKYTYPFDWNADNAWNNRWTLPNGNVTNADPCPAGWRVPTRSEWESAIEHGEWLDKYDAFNSPLKLPAAGKRDDKGVVDYQGTRGYYWSSSDKNIFGEALLTYDDGIFISNYYRVGGMSIRCIKQD